MKNGAALIIPLALLLPACSESYGGDRVHEHSRQNIPAANVLSIRVANVSGHVVITAAKTNAISVDAMKNANDLDAISRTHIDVSRDVDQVRIETRYDEQGGLFSHRNGASVDYDIRVPANVDVGVDNVSGPIRFAGMTGNVRANDVSGSVQAMVGRVSGTRSIQLNDVSGGIDAVIAKDSDARLEARTVSGAIHAFFPASVRKGFVGEVLDGRLGRGTAFVRLSAVSGGITISSP